MTDRATQQRIEAQLWDAMRIALDGLRPGTALSVVRYLLGTLDAVDAVLVHQYSDAIDDAQAATAQAVAELMLTEPHRAAAATVTGWLRDIAADIEMAQAANEPEWAQEI